MSDAIERPRLVLASASPRRLELLRQIGIEPSAVDPADVDEVPFKKELPRAHAERLALAKCVLIAERHPDAFVLAADTVVALGRRILAKPADQDEARRFLTKLSGRRHRVCGGIAVASPDGRHRCRVVETVVQFKRLSEAEIAGYLTSEEWHDKAGGYGIQGRAAAFIPRINGSYSNVVGLALAETASLLDGLGFSACPGDC